MVEYMSLKESKITEMQNTDQEIVAQLLCNNTGMVEYLFYDRCSAMLDYIILNLFNGKADKDELISELYIYLKENDWHKLRQFQFKCRLTTWLSVVATRFFIKKRDSLIEKEPQESLIDKSERGRCGYNPSSYVDRQMDVHNAILMMRNDRYRMVIIELDLNDTNPEELAQRMGITVDNLYNIHKRAYAQLGMIIKRKEDYYYD